MAIEKKDTNHEKQLQDFMGETLEQFNKEVGGTPLGDQPAVKTTKDILPNVLIHVYPLNIVNQTPVAAKTLVSILKQQVECGDKALEEAYAATYQVWWKEAPKEPRYYRLLGLDERDGKTILRLTEVNGQNPQTVEVSGEDMIIPIVYPVYPKYETDYLNLGKRILNEGKWINNERTGKRCLTVINADLEYDVGAGQFPLLTTKHSFWKSAIAEMMGYIRGYTNANDFAALGAKTWLANANENEAWLNSEYRKGDGDMGLVYGAVGNAWPMGKTAMEEYNRNLVDEPRQTIDLLQKVYDDLKQGKDDRGEIWTFYNPGMFHLGCLRPCMYSHHFSILDGTLYLNSTQRQMGVF